MDINQIKDNKRILEQQITDLCKTFEIQTGTIISSIRERHIFEIGMNKPLLIHVEVNASLDYLINN